MDKHQSKVLSLFNLRRILIPILLGLSVAGFLFWRNFDIEVFRSVDWNLRSYVYMGLVLVMLVIRDLAYMLRLRILTDCQLTWKQSFQVIMLWEFASAVTPSIIGGSAIALFIIRREGVSMGRTTAIVLVTALLDELFYILIVPLIMMLVGPHDLFVSEGKYVLMNTRFGTQGIFFIGFIFIVVLTTIILYGVFINPRGTKWLLLNVFRLPVLRRWRPAAAETGNEIIITSREMKGKPPRFWLKSFGSTALSWTARFLVVNMLIMAFVGKGNHLLIFGRQLIMWVILLISPTPGGSGIAEIAFSGFLGEFITPGLAPALGLMWRIISYYPYLFIGVIILPHWLKRVYTKKIP